MSRQVLQDLEIKPEPSAAEVWQKPLFLNNLCRCEFWLSAIERPLYEPLNNKYCVGSCGSMRWKCFSSERVWDFSTKTILQYGKTNNNNNNQSTITIKWNQLLSDWWIGVSSLTFFFDFRSCIIRPKKEVEIKFYYTLFGAASEVANKLRQRIKLNKFYFYYTYFLILLASNNRSRFHFIKNYVKKS